jgi:SAM-dependent methyltransferase
LWLERENAAFAATIPEGSRVLDAGAGEQPYRPLFAHCRYESADFQKVDKPYAESTYVCDLAAIPVEDGCFDAILFNQVMEHLPEPLKTLRELQRILKPGGRIICTAPLFYEEHEKPFDYYRYTQFGWRYLIANAGLEIERLGWMEGYFGTVAYQLETASEYLPRFPKSRDIGLLGWLSLPVVWASIVLFRALAHLFYRLDSRYRETTTGYPKNYVVIAVKPRP